MLIASPRDQPHIACEPSFNDLRASIDKDKDLKENPSEYFEMYLRIIYMLALGHKSESITYLYNKQELRELPLKKIRHHIPRVRSNYKDFVEILNAILIARRRDFEKLGASEAEAYDCTNEWIEFEFGW